MLKIGNVIVRWGFMKGLVIGILPEKNRVGLLLGFLVLEVEAIDNTEKDA